MRVEVGMKERSTKKFASSTWAVNIKQMGDEKTGKELRCPENRGVLESRKT